MSYRVDVDGRFTLDRPLTVEHKVTLEKFSDERHERPDDPGYPWCQWVPSEDGTALEYTDNEVSGYYIAEWLTVIVERFLKPWGYILNGRAQWAGEEPTEPGGLGVIVVWNNEVREADAIIAYPDPFADV